MPNLYGVSQPNPPPIVIGTIGGADVPCPAGVETNIASGPATLPSAPGVYYPAMWGWVLLNFGASVPTSMVISMRVNNGADLGGWVQNAGSFIANENLIAPFGYYGSQFVQSYPIGAFNLQVSIVPGGQACTVRTQGTLFFAQWIRATDQ